jgi:NAD-dependent deacetylase
LDFDKKLIDLIAGSHSIVFFTGAGISAESGIPTFRGKDGIWNKLKPEELANFDAFLRNPQLVWEWYNHRKKIIHESQPNPGHLAIAEFQNICDNVTVITQNIDNLHRRAGSKVVYELHGNIERNYCIKCKARYNEEPVSSVSSLGKPDFTMGVPKCKCGGLIRPDVVWFGELLPEDQYRASEEAASVCDIFFVIGTSAVVYPAAFLVYTAKQSGAYLIEVNTEETEASSIVNTSLFGEAGKILPEILNSVRELK